MLTLKIFIKKIIDLTKDSIFYFLFKKDLQQKSKVIIGNKKIFGQKAMLKNYLNNQSDLFNDINKPVKDIIERVKRVEKLNNKSQLIIFDIGANIGIYSIAYSKIKNSIVYSFEPFPETYDFLSRNIIENSISNIIPYNYGFLDENKKLFMGNPKKDILKNTMFGWLKQNSLFESGYKTINYDKKDSFAINCEFYKGDDFVINNNLNKIDFIKIDVEGSEFKVLSGLNKSLKTLKPIVQIELNKNMSNDIEEIIGLFLTCGYTSYALVNTAKIKNYPIVDLSLNKIYGGKDYLFF